MTTLEDRYAWLDSEAALVGVDAFTCKAGYMDPMTLYKVRSGEITRPPASRVMELPTFARWILAEHPLTNPEVLVVLTTDDDDRTRWRAANNPSTPTDAAMALASDRDSEIRAVVARRKDLDLQACQVLASDRSPAVRNSLRINPAVPGEFKTGHLHRDHADQVAGSMSDEELFAAVEQPETTTRQKVRALWHLLLRGHHNDVLARFSDSPDRKIRNAMTTVQSHTSSGSAGVLEHLDGDFAAAQAGSRSTPDSVLAALAQDPREQIRCQVAQNPTTPRHTLADLAKDPALAVRCQVAQNPTTPRHAFADLAKDPALAVRCQVAQNPHTAVEVLTELASDDTRDVQEVAFNNPSTPVLIRAHGLGVMNGATRFGDSFTSEDLHAVIAETSLDVTITAVAMRLLVDRGERDSLIEAHGTSSDPTIRDALTLVLADLLE